MLNLLALLWPISSCDKLIRNPNTEAGLVIQNPNSSTPFLHFSILPNFQIYLFPISPNTTSCISSQKPVNWFLVLALSPRKTIPHQIQY